MPAENLKKGGTHGDGKGKGKDGMLPGVDKQFCTDEPILPRHALWTWAVLVLLAAFNWGF